ncbi:S-layer homology domain-containing protein [Cellulomonas sp. ATA003]|uniref:S-layer homology domain-containing protein n=1 Tax=Cellulomonas sp. ATA003 TaxID=3073064 RepID=UPI0037C1967C
MRFITRHDPTRSTTRCGGSSPRASPPATATAPSAAPASASREATAAFLHRAAGSPAPAELVREFVDVPTSHRFHDEIRWLASTGITTGYRDGTFQGSGSVSREAMAAFLHRAAGSPAPVGPVREFVDVPADHPFHDAVAWLASTRITTGYRDGTFQGSGAVSREAMAAFLYRYDHAGLRPARSPPRARQPPRPPGLSSPPRQGAPPATELAARRAAPGRPHRAGRPPHRAPFTAPPRRGARRTAEWRCGWRGTPRQPLGRSR